MVTFVTEHWYYAMLTPEEKHRLLEIAREAIANALEGKPQPRVPAPGGGLSRGGGAFVTIRIDHELRGCIGYIESTDPLSEVVSEVAVKAAFDDPRFPPLLPKEFRRSSLEVSVLSPLRQIKDVNEIEVGVHGLVIELGSRRGLLLPQVATEYGWDRMEFLTNVCRKAGLARDAWTSTDAKIHVFSAEVIAEEDPVVRSDHA